MMSRLATSGILWCLSLAVAPGAGRGQEAPGHGEGDPARMTLAEAVAMALETHPAVGQARAAGQAAGARVKQARSALLPGLVGQGSLTRHQEPMIVAPLHRFDPSAPPSFDRNLVQGGLSLEYTLFDGGARGGRIGLAEAGVRATEAGGREATMAVAAQVSAAFLGVLSGQELLVAAQGQMEALTSERERVSQFLEVGKAAQVDLLRVEAALSRAQAQEISVRTDLGVIRGRLARLTGLDPDAARTLTLVPVDARQRPEDDRSAVLARAVQANAGLARAREELSGAEAEVRVASAAWLPRVAANGRYLDFGTLSGGHVQEWQGALQISYPLFTGGAREGEKARAVAEERRAAEALRLAEMEVEDQVETALAGVEEAGALRLALELAVGQTEEVARIEALALDAGAGVQTDFLRAQAELFQARAFLAQARQGEILARIELARVKGDLTLEWIRDNMEAVP